MSNKTYDEEWRKIQDILSSVLQLEPQQADRRENRNLLATLYIRYIIIANKLSECIDQIIQPQKHKLIRKLLEATLGRILELKTDLIEADLNEFTHCGDIIDKLNLTSKQIELKIPTIFRLERETEIKENRNFIENVLNKFGYYDDKKAVKQALSEQQAILVIQIHERARQGRLRAQFMKEIKNMKEKSKPIAATTLTDDGGIVGDDGDYKREQQIGGISLSAALKIQKIWRGYIARRTTRRRKLQEMLLIGMIKPPKLRNSEIDKDNANKECRRNLKKQYQIEYKNEIENYRQYLEKHKKDEILEQLSDQVRNWLIEYKTQTGKIPEYTGSERTGSRLLLSRQGNF